MNYTLSLNLPISIKKLSLKFKLDLKTFWIFSVVLLISLFSLYIFQVNSLISESYSLQKNEEKLNELRRENKNLEINYLRLNSLKNVESQLKEFGFEKVDKIHYIRVLESSVATK